jgi:hypothetical protein
MHDIHGARLNLDRILFLRDVRAGHVTRNDRGRDRLKTGMRNSFVERRAAQEEAAGLIRLDGVTWRTTDAGKYVLADYDSRRGGAVETRTV